MYVLSSLAFRRKLHRWMWRRGAALAAGGRGAWRNINAHARICVCTCAAALGRSCAARVIAPRIISFAIKTGGGGKDGLRAWRKRWRDTGDRVRQPSGKIMKLRQQALRWTSRKRQQRCNGHVRAGISIARQTKAGGSE